MKRVIFGVLLSCVFAASSAAQSFMPYAWSAAGNTGIVDEAGALLYEFNGTGSVAIKTSVASGNLEIRYPVPLMQFAFRPPFDPNSDGPDPRITLRARLRDTGAGARVVVRLRELNLNTGALRTLATYDSDSTTNPSLPSTSYFLYTTYLNVPHTFEFDYVNHAYYVEAQLTKSSSSANPGLMAVQICNPAAACEEN